MSGQLLGGSKLREECKVDGWKSIWPWESHYKKGDKNRTSPTEL